MEKTLLSDYVDEHGQTKTARRAGLSQGAIWQMLESRREIYVIENHDPDDQHTITLQELKTIRRRATAA